MPSPTPLPPERREEAEAIRGLTARLGLPGLVDIHTHFMPPRVLDKVWRYFDGVGGSDEIGGQAWPITYRDDEATRRATLQAFGVRRFTSLFYAHRPGMAAALNDWGRELADRTPGCARSATFFAEPEASEDVRRALDAGAEVFKVHVQVGAFDPADPVLADAWGMIAEAGVPVVLHAGSGPVAGEHTGPGPVVEILRRHPRLCLVVAHMGMPECAAFLDLVDAYPRVHLDTTMVFTDFTEAFMPYPRDLLPRLRELGDRVVLGSDFPNIPYPYLHQLEVLEGLGLGEEWLRAVLWETGSALLGPAVRAHPRRPPHGAAR